MRFPRCGSWAPLLYRARWIRAPLSGEVRSRRERAGSGGPAEQLSGSLRAAPGGRYRADLVDEDGETVCDGESGGMPFPELLCPSWLLAGFDLEITGTAEHAGRTAYAVVGRPREAGRGRAGQPADRVTALVDAELGVLLRYETARQGRSAETAEFTSLRVDAA